MMQGMARTPGFVALRVVALSAALAVATAACTSQDAPPDGNGGASVQISAEVASTDLVAGDPQRFLVGLFASDQRLVSFGAVTLLFASVENEADCSAPQPEAAKSTGRFLPTPGLPQGGETPELTLPSKARGVYATDVAFEAPGIYQVEVLADVVGEGTLRTLTCFAVNEDYTIPGPGDRALHTKNLTLDSKGAPKEAIDSTFAATGRITDPELHQWTIAQAIDEGVPALVVFATPTYCTSQFCGPVVDVVADLAGRYDDRAAFIHVEIWRDNEGGVINEAASDWLYRNDTLTEPWIYLIDSKGRIAERWGPLFDPREIERALRELPELPHPTA
jgi:hypothetical protein